MTLNKLNASREGSKLEQAAHKYEYACRAYMFADNDSKKATATLLLEAAKNDLREALAEQAEQEPLAWILTEVDGTMDFDCQPTIKPTQNDYDALREGETFTPLYAAPVRTKDLTDDEIVKVTGCEKDRPLWLTVSSIARAVIAADREKNRAG